MMMTTILPQENTTPCKLTVSYYILCLTRINHYQTPCNTISWEPIHEKKGIKTNKVNCQYTAAREVDMSLPTIIRTNAFSATFALKVQNLIEKKPVKSYINLWLYTAKPLALT